MNWTCRTGNVFKMFLFIFLSLNCFTSFAQDPSTSNVFHSREYFSSRAIESNKNLFAELENYVAQHRVEAILNEQGTDKLCGRKFIVGTYAGPQAIGNHMHEFLNAFAGAFITNRTIVWKFCARKPCQLDSEQDYDQYITRLPWIASHHLVAKLWKEQKCVGDTNEYHLIPQKFRFQSNKIFMCCGIDKLPFSFLDYGTHELHEVHSLVLNQTRLDPVFKERALLLFHNGEDFGYGTMLRASFQFKSAVIANNNRSIFSGLASNRSVSPDSQDMRSFSEGGNNLFIGMHLRHSSMDDVAGAEHGEFHCMREIVKRFAQSPEHRHLRCVILLATDRPRIIEIWQNRSLQEFNCTTVTTNHTYSLFFNRPEHGPFTGEIAVHDIELVARSDLYLGSSYTAQNLRGSTSTYSLLIASLRATNGGHYAVSVPAFWIPTCGHALGNKLVPDGPYTDKAFVCGNCVHTGILLPEHCPYWNKTSLDENGGKPWVT